MSLKTKYEMDAVPLLHHKDLYGNLFVVKENNEFVNFEEIVSALWNEINVMSEDYSNLKSEKFRLEMENIELKRWWDHTQIELENQ